MAGYDNNGFDDLGNSDIAMEDTDMTTDDNMTQDMLEEYGVWVKVEPEVIEEIKDEKHDYISALDDESKEDESEQITPSESETDFENISFDDLDIPSEEDIDTSEFDSPITPVDEEAGGGIEGFSGGEDIEEFSIDDFMDSEDTGDAVDTGDAAGTEDALEAGDMEISGDTGPEEGAEEAFFDEEDLETDDVDIDISLEDLEEEPEEEILEGDLIPGIEDEIDISEDEIAFDEGESEIAGDTDASFSTEADIGEETELPDIGAGHEEDFEDLNEDDMTDFDIDDIPDLELEESIDHIEPEDTSFETSPEETGIEADQSGESEEIEVPLSEKITDERFDDLETLESSLETSMPKNEAVKAFTPDDTTSILNKIENELFSIKEDLSHLKNELQSLRKPQPAGVAVGDVKVPPSDATGFFDQEEDETIALTGDELNNILNTAEITEEEVDETAVAGEEVSPEEVAGGEGIAIDEVSGGDEADIGGIELEETPMSETWDETPQTEIDSTFEGEEIIDDFHEESQGETSETDEFMDTGFDDEGGEGGTIARNLDEAADIGIEDNVSEEESGLYGEGFEETDMEEKLTGEDEIEFEEGFTDVSGFQEAGADVPQEKSSETGGEREAAPGDEFLALDEEIELEIPEEDVFEEEDVSQDISDVDDAFFDADEAETSSLEAEIDEVLASDEKSGRIDVKTTGKDEKPDIDDLIVENGPPVISEKNEAISETMSDSISGEEEDIVEVSVKDDDLELELPEEESEVDTDFEPGETDEGFEIENEKESGAGRDAESIEEIDISEFGIEEGIEDISAQEEETGLPEVEAIDDTEEIGLPEEDLIPEIEEDESGFPEEEIIPETDEIGQPDEEFISEAEEPELTDETPEEISIDAEEPDMMPSIEIPGDTSGDVGILPEKLKKDLKSVLSYMDELLVNLPEEKIKEFSRSDYWITYKKLFEELGIAPKESDVYSEKA
ncbi:MAG: hypothetical protein JW881_11665 [Spirochaetales bacterium]|nr:hypothetical protein [Spirochaetales bacterium]